MERDSKSREEAERRVASQLSNAERVAQASRRRNSSQSTFKKQSDSLSHFSGKQKKTAANQLLKNSQSVLIIFQASTVLCTLWHPDVTQRQVEEAVERLHKELETSDGS